MAHGRTARRFLQILSMVSVAAVLAGPACSGPPFQTDDPEIPDPGQWEFTLPLTYERGGDGGIEGALPDLDINYGVSKHTQLSLEIPWAYARPEGGPTAAGVGDVNLEVKRRFGTDEKKGYPAINLELTLPTGSARRGLGGGAVGGAVAALYQRAWRANTFYADVSYVWASGDGETDHWFAGAALWREVRHGLEVGAEVYGNTADEPGGDGAAGFSVGASWDFAAGNELQFAAGRSFAGDPELTLYLGANLLTPSVSSG